MSRAPHLVLSLCLFLSLAGCNAGLAGLFAASNSDGGDSNSPNTTVFQPTGSGLRLADLDGDGDLDIAALLGGSTVITGTLSVIDQIAPGVFASHPRMTISNFTGPGRSFFVEDVDGDGEVDFLLPNFVLGVGNGQLTVVWGNR